MKRFPIKKIAQELLVIDPTVNVREPDAYLRVTALAEDIALRKQVTDPLHVRQEDNVVLRGNLRLSAVRMLLANPACPSDLKEAISKLDVLYVSGLTQEETLEYVLDHGNITALSNAEVILVAWRLMANGTSPTHIAKMLYKPLAAYTGNLKKAIEAEMLPPGEQRDALLKTWLNGTLNNKILTAGKLGPLVREQFLLDARAKDRPLTEDEKKKVKFHCGTDKVAKKQRISMLAAAKKEDESSLKGWDPLEGGETFNKLIQTFIEQDSGDGPPPPETFTKTQMVNAAGGLNSDVRFAYQHCAGTIKPEDKIKIQIADQELVRVNEIKKTLRATIDRVAVAEQFSGGEVKELLSLFLAGTDADFSKFVVRFNAK